VSQPVGEDGSPAVQSQAADDRRPFVVGDRVMLLDSKDRRYLQTLSVGGEFHAHAGPVSHDDLIGRPEGVVVRSSRGGSYTAVRPTLAEVILKMPRGAQVIYPKDLGPILMLADIFPGARVLEAGVGSGALSMTLLRAGADVVGYELREDFANRARANVVSFLGPEVLGRYRVELRDVYDGIDEQNLDRMILDLPEPWRVVKHAETALRPGGILVAYLPTIGQVAQLREAMDDSGLGMAETVEVLQRSWHIDGPSVRPDHRMVAHTGFLTAARLLAGKSGGRPSAPYAQAKWDQRRRGSWPDRSGYEPSEPGPEPQAEPGPMPKPERERGSRRERGSGSGSERDFGFGPERDDGSGRERESGSGREDGALGGGAGM
jgi:tRNA (adenine57-N1/adenine58-N1)-methyltransferase